jgi:polygalacturonase
MKRFCQKLSLLLVCAFVLLKADAQKLRKVIVPKFKKDTFNIIKYGAVANGYTLNTIAITKAIVAVIKMVVVLC